MGTNQSKTEKEAPSPSSSAHDYESCHEDWPWVWGIHDPENLDWKIGLSDHDIQATAIRQYDMPVPITDDKVYLGNALSVESISKLQQRGITAVLNMAGPHALHRRTIQAFKKHGIHYKQINAHDEEDYNLLQKHWKEARDFIQTSIQTNETNGRQGGKCVVHCVAGMNRSGLIVAAHHMLATRTTVLYTVKHVRFRRGNVALGNGGFQRQLVAMARREHLLGAAPGTEGSIVRGVPPAAGKDWCKANNVLAKQQQWKDNPLDRLSG